MSSKRVFSSAPAAVAAAEHFSPSETVIVSSFGGGKLNRGGFASVDLTDKTDVEPLIKTEKERQDLNRQVNPDNDADKRAALQSTLQETANNLDLYEQLRKQPIWTVLSAMATAGLCASVNELLEQPRALLANFPNGQYYANDTVIRKSYNNSTVTETRPGLNNPRGIVKTVENDQVRFIHPDVDVPSASVQAILHPLKTKKLPLKDTTNTYLDNALIRLRDFCPSLSTVTKRQWIIDSGNRTLMTRYGTLAGLLLKKDRKDRGQAQRFANEMGEIHKEIYYLEQYCRRFKHLGQNRFLNTETGEERDPEESDEEEDESQESPSYGPIQNWSLKKKMREAGLPHYDDKPYSWRSSDVQLRPLTRN